MQPGTDLRQLRQTHNVTLTQVVAVLNRGLSKEQSAQKITTKQIRNWESAKGLPVLTPSQTKQLLELYGLTDLKELSLATQSTQKRQGSEASGPAVEAVQTDSSEASGPAVEAVQTDTSSEEE